MCPHNSKSSTSRSPEKSRANKSGQVQSRSRSSSPRKNDDMYLFGDPIGPRRSKSQVAKRAPTSYEKEKQEKIDQENRILLRKILEQHHGIRRQSDIPSSRSSRPRARYPNQNRKQTSNQINKQKIKHKTDYENLLLLQKIQNVKPSKQISESFGCLTINNNRR